MTQRSGSIRAARVTLILVLGLILAADASADVLTLTSGGRLKGSLDQVTLVIDQKPVTYARSELADVQISSRGKVYLLLQDKQELRGELVSVQFKSVGGTVVFKREDVGSLTYGADPLVEARKELDEKTSTLAAGDTRALIELAEWCRERGLQPEAAELARACLEAEPEPAYAERAHTLLGHVLYNGEWMTPAEVGEQQKQDAGSAEADVEPDGAPPVDETFKRAIAQNHELYNAGLARIDAEKDKKLDEVKQQYGRQWGELDTRIKSLAAEIIDREKNRDAERERNREELEAGHHSKAEIEALLQARFDDYYSQYNRGIRATREALLQAKVSRATLAGLIKPAQNKILREIAQKKSRLQLVYLRHKRLLVNGRLLTTEEMTAGYDAVFSKD